MHGPLNVRLLCDINLISSMGCPHPVKCNFHGLDKRENAGPMQVQAWVFKNEK